MSASAGVAAGYMTSRPRRTSRRFPSSEALVGGTPPRPPAGCSSGRNPLTSDPSSGGRNPLIADPLSGGRVVRGRGAPRGQLQDGVKPFVCQWCPYRAVRRGDMKKHLRVHTGEKPYGCPLCSFRSADSSALHRHVRARHPSYNPHSQRYEFLL